MTNNNFFELYIKPTLFCEEPDAINPGDKPPDPSGDPNVASAAEDLVKEAMDDFGFKKDEPPVKKEEDPPVKKEEDPPPVKKDDDPPVKKDDPPVKKDDSSLKVPEEIYDPNAKKKDDDDLEGLKISDEKVKNHLIDQRRKLHEAETKLKDFQDPEKNPELLQTKIKELNEKLTTSENIISRVRVEDSAAFKREFIEPKTAIVQQLKDLAKGFDVDESVVNEALAMSTIDRVKYLSEKVPDQIASFSSYFAQMDLLDQRKATTLANHQEYWNEKQGELDKARKDRFESVRESAVASSLAKLTKGGHIAYMKTSDENWNANSDTLVASAKEILTKGDINSQVEAVLMGVAAPMYLQVINAERTKRIAAEKSLKEIHDADPKLKIDSSTRKKGGEPRNMDEIVDSVTSRMK